MNPFKRGDIVRVVDAVGLTRLHRGKCYKVADTDQTCVIVYIGVGSEIDVSRIRADRCELVTRGSVLTPRAVAATEFPTVDPVTKRIAHAMVAFGSPYGSSDPSVGAYLRLPESHSEWAKFLARGGKLKFRSGCDVKFIAFVPEAKPHCQLVLLNPATGNICYRYADGKNNTEPFNDPGDIIIKE